MKAIINGTTIAESKNTIKIEGNQYFPPNSIVDGVLEKTDTPYHCPWKGDAQYFDALVKNQTHKDAAWSYPDLKDSAVEKVGQDFESYIAFDQKQVEIKE